MNKKPRSKLKQINKQKNKNKKVLEHNILESNGKEQLILRGEEKWYIMC